MPRSISRAIPFLAIAMLVLASSSASADDFSAVNSSFSATNTTGTDKQITDKVGNTLSGVAKIITGPVLYIVMGLSIMITVFGFASGQMKLAFLGVGAGILCAVLKAVFALLFA